jgi:hypothetical protein
MVKLKTTKSLQPSGLAIMDRAALFLPPYAIGGSIYFWSN